MYTTIEEANDAYYYKYTTESSKYNIEKIHQLLKSGETEDALRGTANGIISTHHLMYKADTLYSKVGDVDMIFLSNTTPASLQLAYTLAVEVLHLANMTTTNKLQSLMTSGIE